jgi:hypothetical protein
MAHGISLLASRGDLTTDYPKDGFRSFIGGNALVSILVSLSIKRCPPKCTRLFGGRKNALPFSSFQ